MKIAVLFWGAWSRGNVPFWASPTIKQLEARGYTCVCIDYGDGKTDKQVVRNVKMQLTELGILGGDGKYLKKVLGVTYSKGGDIARLLAQSVKGLFSSVIQLASSNENGMPMIGVVRGVSTVPTEFFMGPLGGVELDIASNVAELFFNDMKDRDAALIKARELMLYMAPEPFLCCLGLIPFTKRNWFFDCPVVAIVADQDCMFKTTQYGDEKVDRIMIAGGHGFVVLDYQIDLAMRKAFESPILIEPPAYAV